ncbi:MAG: site-specific DNA-methyltransferase [Alphaproteobacteria bacterium]|nr:site-specific DNA-methyltransferase [Alphaproteobacteria bacterium]
MGSIVSQSSTRASTRVSAQTFTQESLKSLDQVIHGNSLKTMQELPSDSIDVIFADPPYNLQLQAVGTLRRPNDSLVQGVDEEWDAFDNFGAYDQFSKLWLNEARRLLKKDGTLWVIGSYHNIFRVGALVQDLGYWILNDIIWRKSNPMPNFRGRRFTNAHETLLWCARDKKSQYYFNYDAMKAMNDDTQMRSDWLLPLCTGGERLKNKEGAKAHPTQKPESLLHRVILASTKPGDIILDPFFGTGTTGAVAKKLNRHFIGIEQDADYVDLARERLAAIEPIHDHNVYAIPTKREEPRIPFGSLIEQGLLQPGDLLFGPGKRYTAKIRADGTLVTSEFRGSIHQVGAQVQGSPTCNGWQFWNFEVAGQLMPIDILRQKVRSQIQAS